MSTPRVFLAGAAVSMMALAAAGDEPGRGPRDTAATTLKGKKVAIEYGRPPLMGRTVAQVMDLLPPERIWRAGVDQVTSLETEADLLIAGKKVPKGRYTLYVHAPAAGAWTLIVNSDQGTPLKDMFADIPEDMANQVWPRIGTYDDGIKATEVTRAPLKRGRTSAPVERFQITLDPEKNGASALTLAWGDQSWTAELKPAP